MSVCHPRSLAHTLSPPVPAQHAVCLCGSGPRNGRVDGREGVAVCRCAVSGTCVWPRSPVLMCAYAAAVCWGVFAGGWVCLGGLCRVLQDHVAQAQGGERSQHLLLGGWGTGASVLCSPSSRFCPEVLLLAPACERKRRELYPGSLRSSSVFSWKPGCGSTGPSAPWLQPRLPPTQGAAASFSPAWPVHPAPRTFWGCPGSTAPRGPAVPPCTRLSNLYIQIKGCLLLCLLFFF